MKKYYEGSDPSKKHEFEFYRHERVFLLPLQNARRIKSRNSVKYCNNDVREIEARPKQNADIRKCLECSI